MSDVTLPPLRITDPHAFGKVAVLMGGWSAERDISLMSGEAVLAGLRRRGVDAHKVDPRDGFQQVLLEGHFDRAWNALHGRGGEDGTVQGAMEMLGLPYTGSGVLGSAIGMDKVRSKQVFQSEGLGTPEFAVIREGDAPGPCAERIGYPMAVKPAQEGSSIGMTRVDAESGLADAIAKAREYDRTVLLERWIEGPEYTAGILGQVVLPLIRIEPTNEFYDYEAKYFSDETRYVIPCGLDAAAEAVCADAALRAFNAVGARGWGRVDMLLGSDGTPLVLEVNTLPGMTGHSLVPMAAARLGCDFDELVWRILETSFVAPGSEDS